MFPKITKPCPLKAIQLPAEGNFHCQQCKREVHDLSRLNSEAVNLFTTGCHTETCVMYRVNKLSAGVRKLALSGVFAVGASGLALPLAAQDDPFLQDETKDSMASPLEGDSAEFEEFFIFVGGIDTGEADYSSGEEEPPLIPSIEVDDEA